MRDDRWQQIDSLFDEALELTESARGNLLDRECAGDAELRRAVERLLALEFEAENFLAESIVSTPLEGSEDSQPRSVKVDDLAGLSIGPYRLIRPLGRGGMGIVYLAYRENPYHQEVAIKLVRRGLLSVQARRRLEAERQVLAQLEHPNIARLYDGGTTEDGIPYLVMERVIGLPIDDYCDEQRLSIRERLDLVKQVLAAVAHAHHHLSVHCDIKPSNILVTADAIPKLLDFGIVKLLSPKGNEEITVTGPGRRPLTLAYASPEQVQGETITTATDLYSVGVLLHQLLCGHLPYELASGPESGLGRAIVEDDPIPPSRFSLGLRGKGREDGEISESSEALAQSRRLTPRELELCLRGDLDAIVRKAIRKEPHLRYTSAETFADDIDRYLETRPVAARRGTWRYRGGRFVRRLFFAPDTRRRHERWAWTAGLLATLALLPVAAWVQRPPPLCEDANARFDDAWGSAASDAVQDSFLATGLSFADDTFRRVDARLDAYSRDWIATDTEICRATLVRAERSPRLLDLGRLCLEGRREELRSLVELFSKADSTLVTGAVAAVHQLGDIRSCADQVELATRRLPPTDPVVRERLGRIRKVVEAQLLRSKIKLPVDFAVLESAENEVRELDDPPLLARTLFAWGQALAYEKGGAEEGIAKLEDALRFAIGGGDRPLQTEIYAALVKILTRQRGDFERARFWKGFAEASLESLSPGYPGVEYAVYDALGMLAWETAESDLAMSLYRQALESAERQGDPLLQASALSNLGMVDGTATLRAVELLESELGPDHPRLAAPRMNLAAAFASEGRYDEALPLVRQAYQVRRAAAGSDHPELAHPLALSGQILVAQDRPEEALEPFQEALLLLEPTSDTRSQIVRDIQVSLCEAFLLLDRLPDAEAHIVAASSKFGASVSPGHPSRLNFLRVQGDYYRQSGQLEDALAVHQELLALLGPTRTRSPGQAVWPLAGVAKTLLAAGRPAEARGLLEEAWESVSDGDRRLGAEIALDLAGTIRAEDPARASALVEAARKRLSDSVPLHRKLREEIAAMWGRV